MRTVRVLLADSHPIFLEGLRQILHLPEFEIVGAVGDGRALVEEAVQLKPDFVIANVSLPMLNGIQALREIRQSQKNAKCIFLTMHPDAPYAAEALASGAAGYISENAGGEELLAAIRAATRGEIYVSAALRDKVSCALAARRSKTEPHADLLTPREREVLRLLTQGKQVKEIAAALNISPKTVEFHKEKMKNRLGVKTVAELAVYATRQGLAE